MEGSTEALSCKPEPLTAPRCAATTKHGTRCRATTGADRTFCGLHDPDIAYQAREAGRRASLETRRRKVIPAAPEDEPTDTNVIQLTSLPAIAATCQGVARSVAAGSLDVSVGKVVMLAASIAAQTLKAADDIADRAAKRVAGMTDADLDAAIREVVAEHLAGRDA